MNTDKTKDYKTMEEYNKTFNKKDFVTCLAKYKIPSVYAECALESDVLFT